MKKNKFKEIGLNVEIFEPVIFIKPQNISFKNHIIVSEFAYISGGIGTYIGNHVHIATHVSISGGGYCIMEDFSGLSAGTRLITGSAMFNGEGLTSPTLPRNYQAVKRSYIIIKKHATLATNVIVQPGVTIGEGTIVSSGSIVTRDLKPWSIYRGCPAKKVRQRDPKKILELEKKLYSKQKLEPSDFSEIINDIKKQY